jgi:hypothetical protein
MPRFIIHHDGLFFEWSEVVDAPVTRAMSREGFAEYYADRYGPTVAAAMLGDRLDRAVEHGTSAMRPTSAEEMLRGNRAGPGERCLTFDEIIAMVTAAED